MRPVQLCTAGSRTGIASVRFRHSSVRWPGSARSPDRLPGCRHARGEGNAVFLLPDHPRVPCVHLHNFSHHRRQRSHWHAYRLRDEWIGQRCESHHACAIIRIFPSRHLSVPEGTSRHPFLSRGTRVAGRHLCDLWRGGGDSPGRVFSACAAHDVARGMGGMIRSWRAVDVE
jgi:hypothetical protein